MIKSKKILPDGQTAPQQHEVFGSNRFWQKILRRFTFTKITKVWYYMFSWCRFQRRWNCWGWSVCLGPKRIKWIYYILHHILTVTPFNVCHHKHLQCSHIQQTFLGDGPGGSTILCEKLHFYKMTYRFYNHVSTVLKYILILRLFILSFTYIFSIPSNGPSYHGHLTTLDLTSFRSLDKKSSNFQLLK